MNDKDSFKYETHGEIDKEKIEREIYFEIEFIKKIIDQFNNKATLIKCNF